MVCDTKKIKSKVLNRCFIKGAKIGDIKNMYISIEDDDGNTKN